MYLFLFNVFSEQEKTKSLINPQPYNHGITYHSVNKVSYYRLDSHCPFILKKMNFKHSYIIEIEGAYFHGNSSINTLWLDVVESEAVKHQLLSFHEGNDQPGTRQPVRKSS